MTIDIKGVTLAGIDERIVTNPALALSREVNKTQKEAVEELKAQLAEAQEAESLRAVPSDEVASGSESNTDTGGGKGDGSGGGGTGKSDAQPQQTHVNVEA